MILEHLHFCLANHACVSLLLCGQPHLLECYYQNYLIGTHMCTCSIRIISFFTLLCKLLTSCNVSNNASLVSARTGDGGGGGVVNQIRTGLDRGRGVRKIPKFVRTSFINDPKVALKFFIKKRLQRKYFPVDIAKFLRTAFVIEHWWLLST